MIEKKIAIAVAETVAEVCGQTVDHRDIILQKTRKDVEGDLTLVVFPFVKAFRQSPEQVAGILGKALLEKVDDVEHYTVVKGFLNLILADRYWSGFLYNAVDQSAVEKETTQHQDRDSGHRQERDPAQHQETGPGKHQDHDPARHPVIVEYSSPNTNKPLHLGHVRNNLLGYSVACLLEAAGKKVIRANLVNDRGIHICKSMLAWLKYGKGVTPETSGKKGDKLVGDFYVKFESELRKQAGEIMEGKGVSEEEARNGAPLMQEARDLLRRWEQRDPGVVEVWKKMNGWVYEGFDATYKRMGVRFDKMYYESDTYLTGREIVLEGLRDGALYQREDGSVWADLGRYKMDGKLLLRADGTSVYMTQDIGTAQLRYEEFAPGQMIYVVGNEQDHHFKVLKLILQLLGKPYADNIHHLSYGMVELPDGRMKSREGTVVDADDLMDEMVATARRTTEELGKTHDFSEEDKEALYHTIGMGALKYFILRVDPRKNMLFNPEESIDINGNTGPFIQYSYARICSVLRKAGEPRLQEAFRMDESIRMNKKEKQLLKTLYDYDQVLAEAASEMSPAKMANYMYEVAREFNQFYHDHSILNEPDRSTSNFRLSLSQLTAHVIKTGMALLGIEVPVRM